MKKTSRKGWSFVRTMRLELIQAYNAHYPLKVACLPFHHVRVLWDCKNMQYSVKRKIFQKN